MYSPYDVLQATHCAMTKLRELRDVLRWDANGVGEVHTVVGYTTHGPVLLPMIMPTRWRDHGVDAGCEEWCNAVHTCCHHVVYESVEALPRE